MHLELGFLERVLPQAKINTGALLPQEISFSVDSRTILPHQLFVPINGSHVNGHDFIEKALSTCAGAFVSSEKSDLYQALVEKYSSSKVLILVENPLEALYALARAWREQLQASIVGITGSIGKTTTKEYIAYLLKKNEKRCFASQDNQNTLLGIALNILKMNIADEVGVFEVGIGAQAEMVKLVDLLRPSIALITCIGHSHMEGLGSLASIAAEKRKIFSYFSESHIGVINGDQPVLSSVGYPHPIIRFGQKTTNQIQARKIKMLDGSLSFILKIYNKKHHVVLSHTHQGMINNVLAAVTIAHHLGLKDEQIVPLLAHLPFHSQRFEVCHLKHNRGILIDDCYNASPESMKAALLAFEHMPTSGKKIAILGDMLELGEESEFWHRQLGRFLKKSCSVKNLILVGDHIQAARQTAPYGIAIETAANWQEALDKVHSLLDDKNALLVKGSRGMRLEHIVQALAHKSTTHEM